MAIKYTLQCPDCGDRFRVVLEPNDPFPDFCPKCGAFCGTDPNFVPNKVNLTTALGRSGDITYRQLESDTARQAELSGDSSMKVTNLKDNLREGDVAAMPVNNAVTQYAEQAKQEVGFDYFQANTAQYVGDASAGPNARDTGVRALSGIQASKGTQAPPTVRGMAGNWGGGR